MISLHRLMRARKAQDDPWTTEASLEALLAVRAPHRRWRRTSPPDFWTSDPASPAFYTDLMQQPHAGRPDAWSTEPAISTTVASLLARPHHDPHGAVVARQFSVGVGALSMLAVIAAVVSAGIFAGSIGGGFALDTSQKAGPFTVSIVESSGGSALSGSVTPTASPTDGPKKLGAEDDKDKSPTTTPTSDPDATASPSGTASATETGSTTATGTPGDETPGPDGTPTVDPDGTPTPTDGSVTASPTATGDDPASPTASPTATVRPAPFWWPQGEAWPPSWYIPGNPRSELMLGLMSGSGFPDEYPTPTPAATSTPSPAVSATVTPSPDATTTPSPTETPTPSPTPDPTAVPVPSPEWWPAAVAWPPAWLPQDSIVKLSALTTDDLIANGAYGYYLAPGASVTATFFGSCDATVVTVTPVNGTPTPPTLTSTPSVTPTPLPEATPGCTPVPAPNGGFRVDLTWVPYVGWVPVLNPALFVTPTPTVTASTSPSPTQTPSTTPTLPATTTDTPPAGTPTDATTPPTDTPSATGDGDNPPPGEEGGDT